MSIRAVPRRQPPVELDEEPVRIRAAVDEHPSAAAALDEDRVALADVENRDPGGAVRPMGEGRGRGRQPPRPRATRSRAARPVDGYVSARRGAVRRAGTRRSLGAARARRRRAREPVPDRRSADDGQRRRATGDHRPRRPSVTFANGNAAPARIDRAHRREEDPGREARDRRRRRRGRRPGSRPRLRAARPGRRPWPARRAGRSGG